MMNFSVESQTCERVSFPISTEVSFTSTVFLSAQNLSSEARSHLTLYLDPRFATQCHDVFEFAALVVSHAVRVFLENVQDKDLQVFRIFEEYISILVSVTLLPNLGFIH